MSVNNSYANSLTSYSLVKSYLWLNLIVWSRQTDPGVRSVVGYSKPSIV